MAVDRRHDARIDLVDVGVDDPRRPVAVDADVAARPHPTRRLEELHVGFAHDRALLRARLLDDLPPAAHLDIVVGESGDRTVDHAALGIPRSRRR
jgi:hypothetical protein